MRSPRASRSWLMAAVRGVCTEPGFDVILTFLVAERIGTYPLTALDRG